MDDRRPAVPALVLALLVGLLGGFAAGRLVGRPAAASAEPRDDSPVVARVDGAALTLAEVDERWRQLDPPTQAFHGERARALGLPSGRAHFLDELVDEALLAAEADRRGLASRLDVRVGMEACRRRVLTRPLLAEEVRRAAVPESELRAWYEANAQHFGRPARVRLSEIVVTSTVTGPGDATADASAARAKADALRARLDAGEDFAAVASEASEAPSARYGGLVGWIVQGQLAREWESRALELRAGEVTEVLEVPEGFAILRADEREETTIPPLDAVRDDVLDHLLADDEGALQRRYNVFVRELRSQASVEVHPERLGQDDSAAPGGTSATSSGSPAGSEPAER